MRGEFETDSRPIAPEHHGKPAIIRDQRTRPVSKIDNIAKSAKPPSPVQIRAAPPIFHRKSETRPSAGTAIGVDCAQIVPVAIFWRSVRLQPELRWWDWL